MIVARAQLFIESNEARRKLFHEILVTCPGDAPENVGQTRDALARSSLRDKPPQAAFDKQRSNTPGQLDDREAGGADPELCESPTLGFTTFLDTAQISALETKLDELRRDLVAPGFVQSPTDST